MSRRLGAQGCPQVHWRDPSKNPRACGPCGQPNPLTTNTVASTPMICPMIIAASVVLRITAAACIAFWRRLSGRAGAIDPFHLFAAD
jgi:hypothetical protein